MKKIGVGFVGAGWMGRALLEKVHAREDTEIRRLCGRNAERGQALLQELGLPGEGFTGRYEDLVEDPDIDAIFICSPNGHHGAQSIAALEAGKHVFCEKPCATKYAEARQQIALATARPELVTLVDYILHFDSMEERLRRMVAEDTFGTISQIQVNYRHPINIAGDKKWKLDGELMGDAIGMGIIHALSVMVKVMEPQARPVRVYATSQAARVRPFEQPAIWSIQVSFDNEASGFCFGNIDTANGYDAYHSLSGTRGGYLFDSLLDRPQKIRLWSESLAGGQWIYPLDPERCSAQGAEAWPDDTTTPDSGDVIEHQTGEVIAHFFDCIASGTQSPLSFVNSANIADVGWAALASARSGQAIDLPFSAGELLG